MRLTIYSKIYNIIKCPVCDLKISQCKIISIIKFKSHRSHVIKRRKYMLQEYNTVSFKDKKNTVLQKRINYLLTELPDYCQQYELFLRQTSVMKTRAEYLQDIYVFFRYMALKNPDISSAKEVKLSDLEQLNGFDFDDYSAWLIEYRFNPDDESESIKHNSNVTRKRKFASLKSLFHYLSSNHPYQK